MPLVSNLKYHDYQFGVDTPVGRWRWTTRLDVTQSTPAYYIRDIVTPYGLLRDSIPLPGDIVQAMSASIDELRANFSPNILMGPPTSLTFTVDEGRGFALGQSVAVSNKGVYGSLLGVTLTPSANYVKVTPTAVGNLASGETGQFNVEVDSTNLLASSSPYISHLSVQDPTATNNPQTYPITVNVRPKALIAIDVPALVFGATKPGFGPFPANPPQIFQVQNNGLPGSLLEFEIQKLVGPSEWLKGFSPMNGFVGSSAFTPISVTVQPPTYMIPGTYRETLRVSGYSSNNYQDIEIRLVIM